MVSTASAALTVRESTLTTSPSHCCSDACTVIWTTAAISGLLGSNTSCSSEQPRVGCITRSPSRVNSSCSIICRTWSLSEAVAVRPAWSIWSGNAMFTGPPPRCPQRAAASG